MAGFLRGRDSNAIELCAETRRETRRGCVLLVKNLVIVHVIQGMCQSNDGGSDLSLPERGGTAG